MIKLFLDCEFDGFGGELMSIALVGEGHEFYEVININNTPCEWVRENVVPVLYKSAKNKADVRQLLYQFLSQFEQVLVIADWPEDVKHICELILIGPGTAINTPPVLMFQVARYLEYKSDTPHNALEDAKALEKAYFNL